MAFNQRKLDKVYNQSRGIFDRWVYRSDEDTIAEITSPGYFAASRFADDPDWKDNPVFIDVLASDGPYEVQLVGGVASVVSVSDAGSFGVPANSSKDVTDKLQSYFDSNRVCQLSKNATYLVTNLSIPLTSDWQLDMNGATIKAIAGGDTHYLIASKKYLDNAASAQAPCKIFNGYLDGNGIVEHCLIIQNWKSKIELEVFGATGAGIVDTAETRDGTTFPSSSKVNNDWRIVSHDNGGCGFWSKDSAENNATDGNILAGSRFYGNGDVAVMIDAGAGWNVQCQTYNNGGGVFFKTHGKGTLLHDSYIDDGAAGAISSLPESGLTRSIAVKGGKALGASQPGVVPVSDSFINGEVSHAGNGDSPPYGVLSKSNVYGADGYIRHEYFAPTRKMITVGDTFINSDPFRFHNGSSTGRILFSGAHLINKGYKISGEMDATQDESYQLRYAEKSQFDRKFDILPSGNVFSQSAQVPPIGNYSSRAAKLVIYTKDNFNGAVRAEYEANIIVFSKVNGTDSWVTELDTVVYDATDWNTPPSLSVSDNGDGTGSITVNAEQSAASAYGDVSITWLT